MGMMVDVDAAIEAVQDVVSLPIYEFSVLCDKLEEMAVDAEPVKHGRWEHGKTLHKKLYCSSCGCSRPYKKIDRHYLVWSSNYCPNCGAKMKGDN